MGNLILTLYVHAILLLVLLVHMGTMGCMGLIVCLKKEEVDQLLCPVPYPLRASQVTWMSKSAIDADVHYNTTFCLLLYVLTNC